MGNLNDIVRAYKKGKYKKCLELIATSGGTGDFLTNFLMENCRLICESHQRVLENDPIRIYEMLEHHYNFFEKVISLNSISNCVPLQLKLNVTFNFTFWLLFCNDIELDAPEQEEYLEVINKGLLAISGTQTNFLKTADAYEKILINLMNLQNIILNEESKTTFLVLELVVVVIVYLVRLKKNLLENSLKTVMSFIEISRHAVDSQTNVKSTTLCLFKFSLCGSNTLLWDLDFGVFNYLHLLESTLLFLLGDFKGSLNSLQKNLKSALKSLWHYLVTLNLYELSNWDLCFKFVSKGSTFVVHNNLKARFHIVQGKLNSVKRKHKEALKEFKSALLLCANCPVIYYYIGHEYGKMGLIDLMIENFEKLLQVLQSRESEDEFKSNFETVLLDWIHPDDEINEIEAHYVLAVSYGLNESFKSSAETFEKALKLLQSCSSTKQKRIVKLPDFLTILHDASVMNLLFGNLVRAEQICLEAVDCYVAKGFLGRCSQEASLPCKDIEWLKQTIQHDLLETDLELKKLPVEALYSEDLLFFFPENVVALLILSEIQRIQEIEEYKATLSNIFSIFSKYLSVTQKKEMLDEDEKHVSILIKALASKTCVRIAAVQIKEGVNSNVEKMFKRALSCNKGDKDALFNYYNFLMMSGKSKEALKLWNTFFSADNAVPIDSLQSFSLRYFLTDKITTRELEKIQEEVEAADQKLLGV